MNEADLIQVLALILAVSSGAALILMFRDRRQLTPRTRLATVGLLVALAMALMVIRTVDPITTRSLDTEIDDDQYARVGEMLFVPGLRPLAKAALADHRVTRREYMLLMSATRAVPWKHALTARMPGRHGAEGESKVRGIPDGPPSEPRPSDDGFI